MENKTKIVFYLLFCFIIAKIPACRDKIEVRNSDLCVVGADGNWLIRINDNISVKEVIVNNKTFPIDEVIDLRNFDYLYKFKEDSVKINNAYFSHNPSISYFKDKNSLYFLIEDSLRKVRLYKKCRINEYEILGGEYIKVNQDIYWQGKKIQNVDRLSFKTLNVAQNKSEWEVTVGLDRNYIFDGDKIMSQKKFQSLFWIHEDSIKFQYHY